jgi:DNA-binding response OmpR family regulator
VPACLLLRQLPQLRKVNPCTALKVCVWTPCCPAWLSGHVIDLTQREWALLRLLVQQQGQVVSREDVLTAWQAQPAEAGGSSLASNALEVYVHRLRRKLAGSALNIRNIRGLGYMLEHNTLSAG